MELYLFKVLYDIFQIPFVWWKDDKILQYPETGNTQQQMYGEELRKKFEDICKVNRLPVIYLKNEYVFYGLFGSYQNGFYGFGPAVLRASGNEPMKKKRLGLGLMTKILAIAFHEYSGENIRYSDVCVKCNDNVIEQWKSEENLESYMLLQSEHDREHGRGMQFENHIMEIVKHGDIEAMKDAMSGNLPDLGDIGEVSSNKRRQMEYMLVTVLTLITRAAVEGGMNPEDAYALGDVYLQQIEACSNDTGALMMLGMKAQLEFTEKVKLAQEEKSNSLYIEKCKDYIAKHLRKDIKVSDIAPEIGISRTYLTHKFVETEGMTIQQYILKEKCTHAANLLVYSDYSISLISEYFCFSSQSHFGSTFKRLFGMTPNEYRKVNSRVLHNKSIN